MRIYNLNPIADEDIKDTHVMALDESTSTKKASLGQIKKFFNSGTPSIRIPDGTDIYQYFLTAKSGTYAGGSTLANTGEPGKGWYSFIWQVYDPVAGYGMLLEQSNGDTVAVHSLDAGTWSVSSFVKKSGDVMTGYLTIRQDNAGITLQNTTQDKLLALRFMNANDTERGWIGYPEGTGDLTLHNTSAGARIDVTAYGDIVLIPKVTSAAVVNGMLMVIRDSDNIVLKAVTPGGVPKIKGADHTGAIKWQIGTNDPETTLVDWYNFVGNNGIYLHGDGSIQISPREGMDVMTYRRFVPSDYSNFDQRYVMNIQLGAQGSLNKPGDYGWTPVAPAGCVLTGINISDSGGEADTIQNVYYKPMQKYINNQWVTIGG